MATLDVLARHAQSRLDDGNYQDATILYTKCLDLLPKTDSRRLFLLGRRELCYRKSKNNMKALRDAYEMIRLDPKGPKGYIRATETLILMKYNRKAAEVLHRGCKKVPAENNAEIAALRKQLYLANVIVDPPAAEPKKPRAPTDPLVVLPTEIVHMILLELPFVERLHAQRVSKTWCRLIEQSPVLWSSISVAVASSKSSSRNRPVTRAAIVRCLKNARGKLTDLSLGSLSEGATRVFRTQLEAPPAGLVRDDVFRSLRRLRLADDQAFQPALDPLANASSARTLLPTLERLTIDECSTWNPLFAVLCGILPNVVSLDCGFTPDAPTNVEIELGFTRLQKVVLFGRRGQKLAQVHRSLLQMIMRTSPSLRCLYLQNLKITPDVTDPTPDLAFLLPDQDQPATVGMPELMRGSMAAAPYEFDLFAPAAEIAWPLELYVRGCEVLVPVMSIPQTTRVFEMSGCAFSSVASTVFGQTVAVVRSTAVTRDLAVQHGAVPADNVLFRLEQLTLTKNRSVTYRALTTFLQTVSPRLRKLAVGHCPLLTDCTSAPAQDFYATLHRFPDLAELDLSGIMLSGVVPRVLRLPGLRAVNLSDTNVNGNDVVGFVNMSDAHAPAPALSSAEACAMVEARARRDGIDLEIVALKCDRLSYDSVTWLRRLGVRLRHSYSVHDA
ncbi:uncharacterized protein V1510DRAFT_416478 [Dipodascopsis tothii]|uniref:uncharacterized protein n=1 Tax=Dipodascopsis tothii TaxID=44089 RepID=UPI0034CE0862